MHLHNECCAPKTDGAADGFTDWAPWTVWVKQPGCSGKRWFNSQIKPNLYTVHGALLPSVNKQNFQNLHISK